ncbi:MAG: hypothetical protein GVY28_12525 [Alphaproteobacteria bacterium]|nr:hypothetical protein [Alphaproteobacteria bacterium]
MGRRTPIELGLVITIILGVVAATTSYLHVQQRLNSIDRHLANTWTTTHQHLWIELASDRLERGDDLPTVHDVHELYRDLQERTP